MLLSAWSILFCLYWNGNFPTINFSLFPWNLICTLGKLRCRCFHLAFWLRVRVRCYQIFWLYEFTHFLIVWIHGMKSRTSTNTLIVSEDFTCEALPPESHSLNKQTIIQIISRMQKRAKDITFRIMALVRFTATLPVPFFLTVQKIIIAIFLMK